MAPRKQEVYLHVSDMGSDEQFLNKALLGDVMCILAVLFLHVYCLDHRYHIIVRNQLEVLDWIYTALWKGDDDAAGAAQLAKSKGGYFSAVAKIMHVWRELGKSIHDVWLDKNGPESVKECGVKTSPPRCLIGRWGAIDICEARLLRAGASMFLYILTLVLEALGKPKPKKDDGANNPLNELMEGDIEHHIQKMGGYRKDTVRNLGREQFVMLVRIAHQARSVLQMFYNWLKQV